MRSISRGFVCGASVLLLIGCGEATAPPTTAPTDLRVTVPLGVF